MAGCFLAKELKRQTCLLCTTFSHPSKRTSDCSGRRGRAEIQAKEPESLNHHVEECVTLGNSCVDDCSMSLN